MLLGCQDFSCAIPGRYPDIRLRHFPRTIPGYYPSSVDQKPSA